MVNYLKISTLLLCKSETIFHGFVRHYAELCSQKQLKFIEIMNRTIFALLVAIICLPLLSWTSDANDDGPVIVLVKEAVGKGKPQTNHAPARPQIECYYYPSSNSVELSFLSNLGTVTVVLENLTTGEIQDYVCDSSIGRMMLLVSPDNAYRMDIVTGSGRRYYAIFSTDDCF